MCVCIYISSNGNELFIEDSWKWESNGQNSKGDKYDMTYIRPLIQPLPLK